MTTPITPTTSTTPTTPTTPTATAATSSDPMPIRPSPYGQSEQGSQGYLAAIVGGAAGAAALATAGVAVGAALIPVLENPNGGMENLGLILIPLALGALGIVVGMWVGVWATLKRARHHGAVATASITIPLTIVGMFGTTGYFPLQVPILLFGVPSLARLLVVRASTGTTAYPVTIDSSRRTTSVIGGRDAASSAIEREA